MTVEHYLRQAIKSLTSGGVSTARLDSIVLLEDVIGRDRSWLLAHGETEITAEQELELTKLLNQRARHIPLAYVRGKTEFYGHTFVISPAVLEPRPESETMIDLLKSVVSVEILAVLEGKKVHIADVGAGSGALGITAALELKNVQIELLEIDKKAQKVAQTNVDLFTLDIPVRQSDLLSGSQQINHILLCNLPYVPDDHQINLAASHEPKIAIFGGPDGLDLYRKLFKQLQKLPAKPLYILTEALPSQHTALQIVAENSGYMLRQTDDFIQLFCLQA